MTSQTFNLREVDMNRYRIVFLSGAMVVLLGLSAGLLPTSARADHRRLIDAWVAAWNSHDADRVAALFSADAVYEDVPTAAVSHGPVEIRAFAQFYFDAVPDLHVELVQGHLNDGHGTIEWVYSGTDVGIFGTGNTFSVRGVTVLDVHGGSIRRNLDYYDFAKILRDLGRL